MTYKYKIYTLIDISPNLSKNQNRNYDTFCQLINLRCLPIDRSIMRDTKTGKELNYLFQRNDLIENKEYSVWCLEFENIEYVDVHAINNDMDSVPIITELEESIEISTKSIKTFDQNTNSICVLLKNKD